MTGIKRPGRTCATAHCNRIAHTGSYCKACLGYRRAQRAKRTGWIGKQRDTRPEYRTPEYRRARALKIERTPYCELDHLAGCKGGLQVHHINGNAADNRQANLATLCQRHHMRLEGQGKNGQLARALGNVRGTE